MHKARKYIGPLLTAVFALACFVFFGFRYPYHIHYQEQYQLFEWTGAYFTSVVSAPGGLADWCGRFLTQFFYYARGGAAVMALLLAAVQMLTWAACREKNPFVYVMSFLPAVALWLFYCNCDALPGAAVAIILSLAAAFLPGLLKSRVWKYALGLVLVPLLYFLCGPLCVLYVVAVAARERSWRFAVPALVIAALCPVLAQYVFPYPLGRLFGGLHYFRYRTVFPTLAWVSALLSSLTLAVASFKWEGPRFKTVAWTGACVAFVLAAFTGAAVHESADFDAEEVFKYDFMARNQMWNRLMMTADVKPADNPLTVSCVNLALAKSGRMAEHAFEYFQNGPTGLFPSFVRDLLSPLPTAEAFWQLGMVNAAQQYVFEAQEAIPDFQKSGRCYLRLAETNIVNCDYEVARKYVNALKHTAFYRKDALRLEALLGDDAAVDAHPLYGQMRRLRFHEHDFMFSDTEMDSMLGLLYVENGDNRMAYDYLLMYCLLGKDLDRFTECFKLGNFVLPPKPYQEALVLWWVNTYGSLEDISAPVESATVMNFQNFVNDYRASRPESEMEKKYGHTYWFYYFYRYASE